MVIIGFLKDFFGEENLFEITKQEMYLMFPNVFSISPEVVLVADNFTRLIIHMEEKWNMAVERIPYFEIGKMGGLLRCTTMPLKRKKKKKMSVQTTNAILMIRPVAFRWNEETAINNYYQKELIGKDQSEIQELALDEFQAFVKTLIASGIQVLELEDRLSYNTPDSIFPNNWISFHSDGRVGIYPMFAKNRRKERREDVFEFLSKNNFQITEKVDYTYFEKQEKHLEGTGSLVLDRVNKKAYCALSERSNSELLDVFLQGL